MGVVLRRGSELTSEVYVVGMDDEVEEPAERGDGISNGEFISFLRGLVLEFFVLTVPKEDSQAANEKNSNEGYLLSV